MKVTVIGMPVDIIERAAYTIIAIEERPQLDGMPKGLVLPTTPAVISAVCHIAAKQWRRVRAAIVADPSDRLIIEGIGTLPERHGGAVVVYARAVTTVGLQRALKAAQQEGVAVLSS